MQIDYKELFESRCEKLIYYSNFSFLRSKHTNIIENLIKKHLIEIIENDDNAIEIIVNGYKHIFLIRYLEWDSKFFDFPCFKIEYILYNHKNYSILRSAVKNFLQLFFSARWGYCFLDIPSEDNLLIQALNEASFKLIETRLTYYLDLTNFNSPRYPVRKANLDDIANLKDVSSRMVNQYDRFHSDTFFPVNKADSFLGTFAEESVKGFADIVIVPDDANSPDAFVTANYLTQYWDNLGEKVSKMVLSAVSNETRQGWYIKLISEMAYHLKEYGSRYSIMHPASTNKAVIHTYEKLGCKLGQTSHILSISKLQT